MSRPVVSVPVVSVIMPVKNGGQYLAEAVASILRQSFNDLELLLVDDHSSDEAIEQLDRSDPRLRVLKSPQNGVVAAFNHGMQHAKGDYIARMDADDICMPQRLETQLNYLHAHPEVGIAGACVDIFSAQPLAGGNIHYQQWLNATCTAEQIGRQLFVESPIPNPTAIFRRETLFKLGGYRDVDWPEDYDLFLRADQLGISMGKPDEILLRWREHAGRLTRTSQRYSRKRFQQAKAYYLVNGKINGRPVVIWGAGPGGKEFYDLLAQQGCLAEGFIDVHPRRIGGQKRTRPVWSATDPGQWASGVILVAVGARGVRGEIAEFLNSTGRAEGTDYIFVA